MPLLARTSTSKTLWSSNQSVGLEKVKTFTPFLIYSLDLGLECALVRKEEKKNHNEVACADHALLKNLKRVTVISLVTQLWPPTQRFLGVRQALQTPPKNLRVGGY